MMRLPCSAVVSPDDTYNAYVTWMTAIENNWTLPWSPERTVSDDELRRRIRGERTEWEAQESLYVSRETMFSISTAIEIVRVTAPGSLMEMVTAFMQLGVQSTDSPEQFGAAVALLGHGVEAVNAAGEMDMSAVDALPLVNQAGAEAFVLMCKAGFSVDEVYRAIEGNEVPDRDALRMMASLRTDA